MIPEDTCPCIVYINRRSTLELGSEFENFTHINRDQESKIDNILIDIIKYMSNNYGLSKDDIVISRYGSRTGNFNGLIFLFRDDGKRDIVGEIYIVPFFDGFKDGSTVIGYYYKFETCIDFSPPIDDLEYKIKCREFSKFIIGLGLERSVYLNILNLRSSVCRQPIIFTKNNEIELNSFKEFMKKIEEIGNRYVLASFGIESSLR